MSHAEEHGAPRRWLTLLAMTGSLSMIMLDVTVVGVSLPAIQHDLGLTAGQMQWVVNAYILALASLVALGGRAADSFGKVPAFVTGMVVFAGTSVACGFATGATSIVAWRTLQGAAAALMQPASASLVVGSFAPGERGKAMAVYAGIPMLFLAAGPAIGGALTQYASWPWNFWINVPVAVVSLVMTVIARPHEVRRPRAGTDPMGALLLVLGLPTFVFGLMEVHGRGWTDPVVITALLVGATLLPIFVRWELRHPSPLLALQLFRDRGILIDAFILFAMQFAMNGLVIFGSAFLQQALGFEPMQAGVRMLPMLVPVLVVVHIAGRLYDRVGVRKPALIGTALATAGMFVQAGAALLQSYPLLAIGMATLGTGVGFVMSPTNVDSMSRAGPAHRAQASGLVQTIRQIGGSLGVAVVGSTILLSESRLGMPASVALGWSISGMALALAFFAAWRGLSSESPRTLARMSRPIIGITTDISESNGLVSYRVNRQYVQAVHRCGGVAVLLTHEQGDALDLIDAVDGVIITGGKDIDLRKFGQELHPKSDVMNPDRQSGEFGILAALDQRPDKPVLGICLGMQMMGVHRGCHLVQHVPDAIAGGERHQNNQLHPVETQFGKGEVTSSHHQMLGDNGPFEVRGRSPDGCLEAIQLPGRPFYVGVQWHPERTKDPVLGDGMVKRLVDAAAAARAKKEKS
ncbi:MAG: DHA2 family efflux MFS transporter permease subunit [Phycisphaerales bacterium]